MEYMEEEILRFDFPKFGEILHYEKLHHEIYTDGMFDQYSRLMGSPGMPILPDGEIPIMSEEYPKQPDNIEHTSADQKQQCTVPQVVKDVEELFKLWDFSRPEVLSTKGIQIGVSKLPGWPGGDDFAPTRRYYILDAEKCISCEDDHLEEGEQWRGQYDFLSKHPDDMNVDYHFRCCGLDDGFQLSAKSSSEIKQDGNPHQGFSATSYAQIISEDCLYEITFFLTKDAPRPSLQKNLTILDTEEVSLCGHFVPELTHTCLNGSDIAAPDSNTTRNAHCDGMRYEPFSPQSAAASRREHSAASPSDESLLTPRQIERFRRPFNLETFFHTPRKHVASPAAAGGDSLAKPCPPPSAGAHDTSLTCESDDSLMSASSPSLPAGGRHCRAADDPDSCAGGAAADGRPTTPQSSPLLTSVSPWGAATPFDWGMLLSSAGGGAHGGGCTAHGSEAHSHGGDGGGGGGRTHCGGGGESGHGGVRVEYLVPDGPSARSGLVRAGDRIVAVDEVDVRQASVTRVAGLLAAAGGGGKGRVQLTVRRRGPGGHGTLSGVVHSGWIECRPVEATP